MSDSELAKKSLSLALSPNYNIQCVIPDMKLPRSGNLTRLLFAGIYLTRSNDRINYPEIQFWRHEEGSNTTYEKIASTEITGPPQFTGDLNVYQFTFEPPLAVSEGDSLGYSQFPANVSVMGLISVQDRGLINHCLTGETPSVMDLSDAAVQQIMSTPLINFEFCELILTIPKN